MTKQEELKTLPEQEERIMAGIAPLSAVIPYMGFIG